MQVKDFIDNYNVHELFEFPIPNTIALIGFDKLTDDVFDKFIQILKEYKFQKLIINPSDTKTSELVKLVELCSALNINLIRDQTLSELNDPYKFFYVPFDEAELLSSSTYVLGHIRTPQERTPVSQLSETEQSSSDTRSSERPPSRVSTPGGHISDSSTATSTLTDLRSPQPDQHDQSLEKEKSDSDEPVAKRQRKN